MKIKQITIPEGHNARIEGDKIIIEPNDSTEEKIKKWLIGFVEELKKVNPYGLYYGLTASQILDWIKRQKEQKPEERSKREECLMKALQTANARIAELVEENYNLKKSKQEWSVEDECKLHGILADYKSMNATYRHWLKSLPERFNLPPKQEWSVEDEDYFQNLIIAVDSTFGEGNTKNWLQNRFKSLSKRSK